MLNVFEIRRDGPSRIHSLFSVIESHKIVFQSVTTKIVALMFRTITSLSRIYVQGTVVLLHLQSINTRPSA